MEMKMSKRSLLALSLAVLTFGTSTFAQESATLVLRSGERISGQLSDFGGVGFTIHVNGKDRQVPSSDVAIVDFSGRPMADADWARFSEGKHILWLTNGQTVTGQFFDIGGRTPLNITLRTDEGDRHFSSRDVMRIVLARTDNAVAATTGTRAPAPTPAAAPAKTPAPATGIGIVVPAQQGWTNTGIAVRRGEWVTFNTTGEIRLTTDAADVAGAAGSAANRTAANAPLPGTPVGALIGRVGIGPVSSSQPFVIGNQSRVQMPAAGVLFVGINDDHLADNAGEFRVEIQGVRARR
jgi:hypothetical protein